MIRCGLALISGRAVGFPTRAASFVAGKCTRPPCLTVSACSRCLYSWALRPVRTRCDPTSLLGRALRSSTRIACPCSGLLAGHRCEFIRPVVNEVYFQLIWMNKLRIGSDSVVFLAWWSLTKTYCVLPFGDVFLFRAIQQTYKQERIFTARCVCTYYIPAGNNILAR